MTAVLCPCHRVTGHRLFRLGLLLSSAAAVLWGLAAARMSVAAQTRSIRPGDTVVVVKGGVELGTRSKVVAILSKGTKIRVTEVRGPWIGGVAVVEGRRHIGWVHRSEVRLAEGLSDAVPVIPMPPEPDDAEAIAALKAAGARLETNDQGHVLAVDATESQLTDALLAKVRGLHQLSTLDLSGRPVSDEGLKSLAGIRTLQQLYLAHTGVTDSGLEFVKTLPNLEVLVLQGTKVTGPGLVHLVALKNLRVLNLAGCAVGDDALRPLEQMPQLEVLVLAGTRVTSAGLAHLEPIDKLRVLNLIDCNVDDQGLEHLKGLANLRMLYVRGTKVTRQAIKRFKKAAPSLAIFKH